jgi:hypothetical protein
MVSVEKHRQIVRLLFLRPRAACAYHLRDGVAARALNINIRLIFGEFVLRLPDFANAMTINDALIPKNVVRHVANSSNNCRQTMKAFLICTLVAALAVLFTGCDRDNVKVYHVEKDDTSTPQAPAPASAPDAMPTTMHAGLPVPDASTLPKLKYTLPDGWQEKTPTEMRVASFGISENGKNADVSVIPLGGMAGGDLSNVNRWRGQVGLQPLADDNLQNLAEKVEIAGQPADLYDVAGTNQRIVGVIFHRDDATWFFKMTGDADLIEKQKPSFVSFLKSFQFGGLAARSAMDLNKLPEGHPSIAGMDAGNTTATDAGNIPTWTIPADWQSAPLSQFLIAKFSITDANGRQAAVNVSSLAGDGGGLLPNVNRWRAQLGLAPVAETDLANLPTIDASGGTATLIDISGTDARTGKPERLVGVVLPLGGQTRFYKLMGDPEIVAQQKDAFTKFIQSAKYPDAH